MNYTLHQLLVFLKVCETGSITKTADELFLTQPAISIQLKKFQDQFDLPLTELIGRKIYITEFGKELEKVAKRIVKEAESINQTVNQFKGLLVGNLTFSIVSTGKYIMPYFLSEFIEKHKTINIIIDVTNRSKVLEALEKNETDFALVSVLPDGIETEKVELMENRLYLVKSSNFNLDSKNMTFEQLADTRLIYREKGSATRNAMEQFLKNNLIRPNNSLEMVSNEAVKQAVMAGMGYSIMPLIGIKDKISSGQLQIVPMKGLPIITSWNLVYNKNKNLSPAAVAFLEHINNNKSNIINKFFGIFDEIKN
jgi:LysR family transcriptional regulator, low CO2-responsive transcriptional regulator